MRYFFPQELDLALRCHGLDLLQLSRFPDGEAPPDERPGTLSAWRGRGNGTRHSPGAATNQLRLATTPRRRKQSSNECTVTGIHRNSCQRNSARQDQVPKFQPALFIKVA